MRLHRYVKEENIDLAFDPLGTFADPDAEREDPEDMPQFRRFEEEKVPVLKKLVELLEPSGRITNPKKCLTDLRNREAKATTALGLGIAMPHVRTPQAKDFAFGVAITPSPGIWFDAVDDEPVRIFFPMVAPNYKDKYYRKVEKALAEALLDEEDNLRDALLEAKTKGEVIHALARLIDL